MSVYSFNYGLNSSLYKCTYIYICLTHYPPLGFHVSCIAFLCSILMYYSFVSHISIITVFFNRSYIQRGKKRKTPNVKKNTKEKNNEMKTKKNQVCKMTRGENGKGKRRKRRRKDGVGGGSKNANTKRTLNLCVRDGPSN